MGNRNAGRGVGKRFWVHVSLEASMQIFKVIFLSEVIVNVREYLKILKASKIVGASKHTQIPL